MTSLRAHAPSFFVLMACAALAVACYAPGLSGPFLLDDYPNFEPISRWLAGDLSLQAVVFGNGSGPLGRPLSMASFVASAAAGGMEPFGFKAGNLLLHVANGVLLMLLFARIAPPGRAATGAALAAACWLLLPIHVSTVLYAVQRMAMLATTFMLVALVAYAAGRAAMRDGRDRTAALWLFGAVPAATILGLSAKENGVLVPLLALVLEVTVFASWRRTRAVVLFHAVGVALPLAALVVLLVLRPESVIGGYALRDFGLSERLLTEARALWSYARASLAPSLPQLGLVHDDYVVSRSLLQPATTLPAVLALAAVAGAAIAGRKRFPLAAFGVLFFLAAHALESSLLPLEPYFEHRNYLASAGLVAVAWDLVSRLRAAATGRLRPVLAVALGAIVAIYAFGTWTRAATWRSFDEWLAHEAARAPASPRIRAMQAARAMESRDLGAALAHVDAVESALPASLRARADALRLLAYCMVDQPPPADVLERAARRAPRYIGSDGINAYARLAGRVAAGECQSTDADAVVAMASRWTEGAREPATSVNAWRMRYHAAEVDAARGHVSAALALTLDAWRDSGQNAGVGVQLFRLYATLGRLDDARALLATIAREAEPSDRALRRNLDAFEAWLVQQERAREATPPTAEVPQGPGEPVR